ncbi:hypothetical protein SRABI118_02580 [Massilia sp. Bi118]|nr:hypothetical protein SRABI118_02580 [Massilia sp. Bi118]
MRDRVQHLRDELTRKTDDRARPERIQLLEVRLEPLNPMQESRDKVAARLAVWQAISCQRLVELVMT